MCVYIFLFVKMYIIVRCPLSGSIDVVICVLFVDVCLSGDYVHSLWHDALVVIVCISCVCVS